MDVPGGVFMAQCQSGCLQLEPPRSIREYLAIIIPEKNPAASQ